MKMVVRTISSYRYLILDNNNYLSLKIWAVALHGDGRFCLSSLPFKIWIKTVGWAETFPLRFENVLTV